MKVFRNLFLSEVLPVTLLKDGAIEYTDEAWGEPDALTFTADWQKNGNVVINVDCPDRVGGFYVGTLKFTLKKYNNI